MRYINRMSKIILFTGGGSKGAFQAGVYSQLLEQGYDPAAAGGISVGALNAIMVSTGRGEQLHEVWENISEDQVLKRRKLWRVGARLLLRGMGITRPLLGFHDNSPLRDLIKQHIGKEFFRDFFCGTVDLSTGLYVEHHGQPGDYPHNLIDGTLASTAIPGVFDAVKVDGTLHVDGGVRRMSPIGRVLDLYSPDHLVIVSTQKFTGRGTPELREPHDIIDVVRMSLDDMMNEIFLKDLRQLIQINRLIMQAERAGIELKKPDGRPYKYYKTILYQPGFSLGNSMNFSAEQARRNLDIGRTTKPMELI